MSISRMITSFSLAISVRRQSGVAHDVAKNIDRHLRPRVRNIDVINRPIKGRISVHVTAGFLHFLIDSPAGAVGRCP